MSRGSGFSQTEAGVIPKGWVVARLSDVASDFLSGGTPTTSNPAYWGGNIPWMRSASIKDKLVTSGEKFITEEGLHSSATNVVPAGNILIATRVSIGNVAINAIDVAISQDLTGVIVRNDLTSPEYLYWSLKGIEGRMKQFIQGSTISGVLRSDLEKLRILLPPLPEQQKITSILSTVDDTIRKTDEIIARTQQLKKGLMQQLLTKGIGHTKFKMTEIGEIPEEWDVCDFDHLLVDGTRNGLYKDANSYGRGSKIVRMTDFFKSDILDVSQAKKVTVTDVELQRFSLHEGDLLFARRSLKAEGSGKCIIVPSIQEPIVFESSIIRARPSKERAFPLFYYYYLNSGLGRKAIGRIVRTVAVSGVTGQDIRRLELPCPSSSEQEKIATYLRNLDERIRADLKLVNLFTALKKGLMQVLLTGKVRVKVN